MAEMNAVQLKKALLGMPPNRAVFIWGAPGTGKSQICRQVAEQLKIPLIDVRLAMLDPTDLRGLPFLKDGEAIWARPIFIPDEKRHGPDGILLLDEINAAPPSVQAASYQLTLDRQIGEHRIPEGWRVWCAGNREGDRAVTYKLPSPLTSRLVHLELVPDLESWKEWAYGKVNDRVIGFLSWRNEMLFKFDPTKFSRAFPCPRSWQIASEVLEAFKNDDRDFQRTLLSGCVGDGPAAEFIGYLRMADELPLPEEIMEKGKDYIPTDPSTLYAVCASITGYIKRKTVSGAKVPPMLDRMLEYSLKLQEEYAVMLVNDNLKDNRETMRKCRTWNAWAQKFKNVII